MVVLPRISPFTILFMSKSTILLLALVLAACNSRPAETIQNQPTKYLFSVLQQFIKADTLKQYPKFYAAFVKQELPVGNLSVYLFDEYNSNGEASICPSTTWKVDKKVFFVYTGLEGMSSACDTSQYSLIKAAYSANNGKIWSPPFRCWKVSVKRRQIIGIDKQPDLLDFFGANLGPLPPPPPL